jgi:hypothetical protein
MTKEQFCTFFAEDVQNDWRKREAREMCVEIASQLPNKGVLSVTRNIRTRYPAETLEPLQWTQEDDATLKKLVVETGHQWTVIGPQMGRTPDMVRLRWRDYVSVRDQRHGPWDDDEMERLYNYVLSLLEENGWTEDKGLEVDVVSQYVNWGAVSSKVRQRSQLQCRIKWERLEGWRHKVTGHEG